MVSAFVFVVVLSFENRLGFPLLLSEPLRTIKDIYSNCFGFVYLFKFRLTLVLNLFAIHEFSLLQVIVK